MPDGAGTSEESAAVVDGVGTCQGTRGRKACCAHQLVNITVRSLPEGAEGEGTTAWQGTTPTPILQAILQCAQSVPQSDSIVAVGRLGQQCLEAGRQLIHLGLESRHFRSLGSRGHFKGNPVLSLSGLWVAIGAGLWLAKHDAVVGGTAIVGSVGALQAFREGQSMWVVGLANGRKESVGDPGVLGACATRWQYAVMGKPRGRRVD